MIKERLKKEIENNVALQLQPAADPESINVEGRGELQIGILVETMRREGFELTISPPKVHHYPHRYLFTHLISITSIPCNMIVLLVGIDT
jgi:hypothetical protein